MLNKVLNTILQTDSFRTSHCSSDDTLWVEKLEYTQQQKYWLFFFKYVKLPIDSACQLCCKYKLFTTWYPLYLMSSLILSEMIKYPCSSAIPISPEMSWQNIWKFGHLHFFLQNVYETAYLSVSCKSLYWHII